MTDICGERLQVVELLGTLKSNVQTPLQTLQFSPCCGKCRRVRRNIVIKKNVESEGRKY
jgi:hypothetical protein